MIDQQVNTLRELTRAVQAYDRSIQEFATALLGREFNREELNLLLNSVRDLDHREITASTIEQISTALA